MGGQANTPPALGTQVNQTPSVTSPSLAVTEGGEVPVTSVMLGVSDVDDGPMNVQIQLSNVTNGKFVNTAAVDPSVAVLTFTLADVEGGDIKFIHDGGAAPTFSVAAKDDEAGATFGTPEVATIPIQRLTIFR